MKVVMSHPFDCTPDTFWRRIFFDDEYNRALFVGELGFPAWEVRKLERTDARVDRTVFITPQQKGPEVLRKVISGTLSYEEIGTWTASDGVYRFRTVPNSMAEKTRIEGTIRAKPVGADRMERQLELDVEVKVMLVGGTIEKFLAGEIRSNYDHGAAFTRRWIAEHPG
jgi:hypothetical protein